MKTTETNNDAARDAGQKIDPYQLWQQYSYADAVNFAAGKLLEFADAQSNATGIENNRDSFEARKLEHDLRKFLDRMQEEMRFK
jgi:hypothetical protein